MFLFYISEILQHFENNTSSVLCNKLNIISVSSQRWRCRLLAARHAMFFHATAGWQKTKMTKKQLGNYQPQDLGSKSLSQVGDLLGILFQYSVLMKIS